MHGMVCCIKQEGGWAGFLRSIHGSIDGMLLRRLEPEEGVGSFLRS